MAICYSVESKQNYKTDGAKVKSLKDAKGLLKRMICESCSIMPELRAINNPQLPSPKYRASVCRYLKMLFDPTADFPTPDMIDYSDFDGEPLDFYAEDYQSIIDVELYDRADEYDVSLGFVFGVGKDGMVIEFLNSVNSLMTKCFITLSDESILFSFETLTKGRPSLDVRISKVEGTYPKMLTGSFHLVCLLDELLHRSGKCQIEPRDLEDFSFENIGQIKELSDNDHYLYYVLSDRIFECMQENHVLPSDVNRSPITIGRDMDKLYDFGFEIKNDRRQLTLCDYKGDNVTHVIDRYYIPPLICKKDADVIINSINEFCSEERKNILIEKFKNEAGYIRAIENDTEEMNYPLPRTEEWSKGFSSLIMFYMLFLCARPLAVTSDDGESLQGLISEHFGVELKKNAMLSNLNSMAKIGLPITEVKKNVYCFDTNVKLLDNDLDEIKGSIRANSHLNEYRKDELIRKINRKFLSGKF